jgi:hypothetical protein
MTILCDDHDGCIWSDLFGGLDLSSPEIADQKETNSVAEMDLGIVISGPQRSVSDRQGPAIAKIPIHRQRQDHQITRWPPADLVGRFPTTRWLYSGRSAARKGLAIAAGG